MVNGRLMRVQSVSLSSDGTTVAIGTPLTMVTGMNLVMFALRQE